MQGGLHSVLGVAALTSQLLTAPMAVTPPDLPGPAVTAAVNGVQLLAADALIMTGTEMHNVDPAWLDLVVRSFVAPTLGGDYTAYTAIPVATPAEFWPFGGLYDESLDDSVAEGTVILEEAIAARLAANAQAGQPDRPIVVFGYSQSAIIATVEKRHLAALAAQGQTPPPLTFVVTGNPNRPNGGLNERFAGLTLWPGWTFSGATPTDTPFATIDIARQYDPFADFPLYPLNLFALLNAVMGLFYAHDYSVVSLDPADPRYNPDTVVRQFGDTTYYLIPAAHLPLLQPFYDLGVPPALLDAVEQPLRVLVEAGYDRNIPPGQPAPARISPQIGSALPGDRTSPVSAVGRPVPDALLHPVAAHRGAHHHDSTRARKAGATPAP